MRALLALDKLDDKHLADIPLKRFTRFVRGQMLRVNVLLMGNAILMVVMVGIGAYGHRYRHHPLTRFLFMGATILFLPIVSYIVSITGSQYTMAVASDPFVPRKFVGLLLQCKCKLVRPWQDNMNQCSVIAFHPKKFTPVARPQKKGIMVPKEVKAAIVNTLRSSSSSSRGDDLRNGKMTRKQLGIQVGDNFVQARGAQGAQRALHRAVPRATPEQEYRQLVELLSSAGSEYKVLKEGARLGKQLAELMKGEEEAAWKALARFWCEMILHLAPSDNLDGHALAIARGGELITLLWALLTHVSVPEAVASTTTTTTRVLLLI
uniref:Uncharacterized protein n=1 Tax=Avena sativa TaxID=4498 RepID=A0ACD5YV14_AVESA